MGRKLINDNVNTILRILFKKLGIRYDIDILHNLKEHPDFPSFLSFQYILKREGVDCIALKTNIEQLRDELPKPVLVHVVTNTDLFLLINQVDSAQVHIINEHGTIEREGIENFSKMWDGNAMIFDSDIIKPRSITFQEKILLLLSKARIPFIITVLIMAVIYNIFKNYELRETNNFLFLLFSAIGVLFSVLLLVENLDEHNPLVKKICTSGKSKKVNCSSILNSKDAMFIGLFSWSDIGFVFFTFLFIINLLLYNNIAHLTTSIVSMMSFPYVFYSITYQKFVARSWCRLCLGVQAMLAALFIVSLLSLSSTEFSLFEQYESFVPVVLTMFFIIVVFISIKPLLTRFYELRGTSSTFNSLKHNHEIKQLIFQKQLLITPTNGIGLVCGNPRGSICLTLVISPVCNPCMNELRTLLPILKRKEDTRVELIFLTDKKENEPLAFKLAMLLIGKYLSSEKDFLDELVNFVNGYPASKFKYKRDRFLNNEDVAEQLLLDQIKWCISNKIYSTPRFFIDGRALPSFYSVKDIDYMCT